MRKWRDATNLLVAVAAVGWLALMMPSSASATPIADATSFTSVFANSNIAGTGNFGNLGISCNGTTCTVTLTPNGTDFFGNNFLGFDLSSGASNIVLSSAVVTAGGTLGAGGNFDGFGPFTNSISLP